MSISHGSYQELAGDIISQAGGIVRSSKKI
jgi:hypothetical protein